MKGAISRSGVLSITMVSVFLGNNIIRDFQGREGERN